MRLDETLKLNPKVISIRDRNMFQEGGFHVFYAIDNEVYNGPSFVTVKSNDYGDFETVNFSPRRFLRILTKVKIIIRFTKVTIYICEKVGYESLFEEFTTKLKNILRENDIEFEESAGGKRSKRRKSRRSRKSRKIRK